MPTSKTDVLVVGAGPTGLTMACEILRHGLSVRVVEELEAPVIYSKAAVVHARTMEVFDDMGVVGAILERSKPVHGANVYAEGKRVAHVGFEGVDSPYPSPYGISQRDTELILAARLTELGGTVERRKRLTGLTQQDGGVTATVDLAEGGTESIEAAWIVGCDGAHSAVRKLLGFTFEGSSYEDHLIQADVRVEWPMKTEDDEILVFLHPQGPLACFPLFKDGRYRLIGFLLPGAPDMEPTMENFQLLVDERIPGGAKVGDPAWTVAFRIHCRRTDRYRDRRAFIAGDAAHIHSPAGGQGMNTGIQDAYNLAWKLALVHRGKAHDALLDSYEAERQGVARALLASTDTLTRGMERISGLRHPLAVGLRNQFLSLATSLSITRSRASTAMSMIEINYRDSPVVRQDRASVWQAAILGSSATEAPNLADWAVFGDGPAPGDRAPDAELTPASPLTIGDTPTRPGRALLFDVLRGTRHTLLLFDGAAPTEEGYRNLAQIGQRVRERYGDVIAVHVVVPYAAPPAALVWDGSVICDSESEVHRRYGARSECLYLIRPDGYVAYRCQPADGERLAAYLGTIFTG
jgi:2-polyprenyl-6-methoxyphenol hydroxylase-like FAD-dependent oxidoreductase